MSVEKRFSASFHGHSPHSDGLSPISDLVDKAAQTGIRFFGISDHNTTNGIEDLFMEIDRVKDALGVNMVPISAVEITTNQGDLLIAKPGDYDSEFTRWGNIWSDERKKHGVAETIDTAVRNFDAVAVIVHPGEPLLSGVPFEVVRQLPEKLEQTVLNNVGLEVRNWSSTLMPKRARLRELGVGRLATSFNLAQFGFSDFHHAWMIPKQFTYIDIESENPTPEDFMIAIQQRKVYPSKGDSTSPINWLRLVFTFGTTHFQHPNFEKIKR